MPYEMLTSLTLRTSYTLADEDDGSGTQRPCIRYGCGPVCWKWARLKGSGPTASTGAASWVSRLSTRCATGTVSAYTLSIRCSCVFREGMLSLQLACGRCMLHRQLSLPRVLSVPWLPSPRLGRYRGFPRRISWRYSDKWHLNLVGIAEFITDV